jgi:DMSO/TMAO reductase YedYZ molybdopterin-dependent catalytic subunit
VPIAQSPLEVYCYIYLTYKVGNLLLVRWLRQAQRCGEALIVALTRNRRIRVARARAVVYQRAVSGEGISREELQLAARNHGMPLEMLRSPITPTGLHYTLIHYDIPPANRGAWRLGVGGSVRTPTELSLDDIEAMPGVTIPVTLECAGNGRAYLDPRPVSQPWLNEAVGTAEWSGTPLSTILERVGPSPSAMEVAFRGADRGVEEGAVQNFERSLPMDEAMRPEVIVAYAMNGRPLPPQHGYPLRLVVPGYYGMASVKWLERITVLSKPFTGHQQARAYRLRQDEAEEGDPLTRMAPRSLMVPPGIPEFPSRLRHVRPSTVLLEGRAWSGWARIVRVDVSTDGGRTWTKAILGEPTGPHAWTAWSLEWVATSGEYELACRATDETGRTQPLEPAWSLGGYANNEVHRVKVIVSEKR